MTLVTKILVALYIIGVLFSFLLLILNLILVIAELKKKDQYTPKAVKHNTLKFIILSLFSWYSLPVLIPQVILELRTYLKPDINK